MMREEFNDYELVNLAQEYNEDALMILNQKYSSFIQKLSYKYYRVLQNKGVELSDIMQECTLAFEQAIHHFNSNEGVCFYTFATSCMKKQLITTVRKYQREKFQILNESISLDDGVSFEEETTLLNFIDNRQQNPLESMIEEEEYQLFLEKVIKNLSWLEECVLTLRIQEFNYHEIASVLDRDKKCVDNAVQRIRIKIKKYLKLI